MDELVGRSDMLCAKGQNTDEQATIDLSRILEQPVCRKGQKVIFDPKQVYNFELEKTLDEKVLIRIQICVGKGKKRDCSWM